MIAPGHNLLGGQPLIVSAGDKTGDSLPGDLGGQSGGQMEPGGGGGANGGEGAQVHNQAIQLTGRWPVLYLTDTKTKQF